MDFELKRFQQEHYAEYASWFTDPELDRHLGPIDRERLDAVLSQAEAAGVTWAIFRHRDLVAVVETLFDPENPFAAAITAIAVKPSLRRQGIGTSVLQLILALHRKNGIVEHVVYISLDNIGGQRCATRAGFVPVTSEPDERGYIEFHHLQ